MRNVAIPHGLKSWTQVKMNIARTINHLRKIMENRHEDKTTNFIKKEICRLETTYNEIEKKQNEEKEEQKAAEKNK